MNKSILTSIVCFLITINVMAQGYLSLNSKFYVAGQKLTYSYYSVEEESLVSLHLIDANNNVLRSQYHKFTNTYFSGAFEIPVELSDGIYYLLSYNSSGYIVIPISIGVADEIKFALDSNIVEKRYDGLENKYNVHDTIFIEKLLSRDITAALVNVIPYSKELPLVYQYKGLNEDFYEFEIKLEGNGLEGADIAYSTFNSYDEMVNLSFGKVQNGKVRVNDKTINSGEYIRFCIDLKDESTLLSASWRPVLINLVKKSDFPEFKTLLTKEEAKSYVRDLKVRQKIYTDFSNDVVISRNESVEVIKWPKDYSVNVGDYYPFESTSDLIKEILPWVKVKDSKRDGTEIVLLTNSYNTKINRKPMTLYNYQTLCIVDGTVIFDHNKILSIKPESIESIDVYLNKIVVAERFFNGIISINSKDNIDVNSLGAIVKLDLPTISRYGTYKDVVNVNSEINFFSPVFTAPVQIENGVIRVNFKHSSEKGRFLINMNLIGTEGIKDTSQIIYNVN